MTAVDNMWQRIKNHRWTPRVVIVLFLLVVGFVAFRSCG